MRGLGHWVRLFVLIFFIIGSTVAVTLAVLELEKPDIGILDAKAQSEASYQLLKFAKEAWEQEMIFFRVKGTTLCVGYVYQGHSAIAFPVDCEKVKDRLINFDAR